MEKFVISKDYVKNIRRFNTKSRTLEFNIKPVPENMEAIGWVKEAVSQIVMKATEDLAPTDKVGFTFCSNNFERGQGWLHFQDAEKVTVEDVWGVLNGIFQSNSSGLDTDTFCLGVTSVRLPVGRGKGKNYNTFEQECKNRRGIIAINNSDNLCLPRALVVSIANVCKHPEYNKVRVNQKIQQERAVKLLQDAGVEIPEEGAGIPELQKFQQYLTDYKIVVYRYGSKGRDVIYKGTNEGKNINLLYYENHYNVITSLTAAFCCSYFCEQCHVPFDHKNKHRCSKTCSACQQLPSCEPGLKIKCLDCLRSFKSQCCYDNHKMPGSLDKSTVCQKVRLCHNCLKTIKSDRQHTCGEIFCKLCLKHQPEGHLCYMKRDIGKPKLKDFLYIFYDLETRQEKQLKDGSFEHEPDLCVSKQSCEKCIQEPSLYFCQTCGFRTKVIKQNVISQFMEYLIQIRKRFKDVIVIAHNGQAFDHQFILNHILTETDLTPELIMRGTKIILMQVENVKFLDSLNYFPMPLSAFSKAFGLPDKFKKGYFPHLFNKKENANYVGPLPAVEYYSPNTMRQEERTIFLAWYEEHKNDEFNMQRDLVDYCGSDVEILTEACLKFREQMITTTNVCPFSEASTIPSTCNKVFRRNFLKPNTIGIIPKNGYRFRDNQSKIALQWLIWEEQQRKINIQHAAKGQEAILHGYKVDGFCRETNQILEFHGCYYHGCPSCFKHRRNEPLPDNPTETLDYRCETTAAKTERLRSLGYEVIEKWECDFKRELRENSEIDVYTGKHPLLYCVPLNPRDAFYGGRTGNTREYYKCQEGEKIKYLDVCSLYPWVCKYGKFPIGHPEVFVGDECLTLNLEETNGLIKCKILPPQNLYHPVLPKKINNKLMFVLCQKCGEMQNSKECNHSDEDRAISGTWVIDEVLKGIEKGYKILHVYEIWKYQIEQYDINAKTGGLFVKMMNTFLKIKQEASGWPGDCVTEERKNLYINDFFIHEGIQLDFHAIRKNAGLRCLAKLMLNSFWGKLGQRENQPKTKIVNNPEDFFSVLSNPSITVNSILPVNENVLVVNYEFREESFEPLSTVNVCHAAYTTAQARLKLYSYLEQLDERVLYYDTDSVIYVHKDGQFEPPTGEFIGDMTDELQDYGAGSYISEFACGGPKNYAYKFYSTTENKEKLVCKVKGFCLNYDTSQLINFDTIRDMILKVDSEPLKIVSNNIRRTKEHEVVTKKETKLYKLNSLKRKFFEDYTSIPYGFKKIKHL